MHYAPHSVFCSHELGDVMQLGPGWHAASEQRSARRGGASLTTPLVYVVRGGATASERNALREDSSQHPRGGYSDDSEQA
jgi:hypothetical protein